MSGLWPAGAELGLRVPAGCWAVPQPAGKAGIHHGSGEGQPAILLSGKPVRKEGGALWLQEHIPARGYTDNLIAMCQCTGFPGRFARLFRDSVQRISAVKPVWHSFFGVVPDKL